MSNDAKSKSSCKWLVTVAELWASKDGFMVVQTTKQWYMQLVHTNK
jgi:hypothetical protein